MPTPFEESRIRVVKAELAERLREICAEMSDPEFEEMIERMARIQVKYAVRAHDDLDHRREP